ncbi:MAG: GAF domain-containing protein [Candidatus Omnitrophota bacterium]
MSMHIGAFLKKAVTFGRRDRRAQGHMAELKAFMLEVVDVMDMDDLLKLTIDKLTGAMGLSSCAVLLYDKESEQFRIKASNGIQDPSVVLKRNDRFVSFLQGFRGYVLRKERSPDKARVPDDILEVMDGLSAELTIAMALRGNVTGILSLGRKKTGGEYTEDDLAVLLPLAKMLAVAISNAGLFEELGRTQAEAAQKEKLAVIGTLSAGINHEICNPLGIARGQCEAFLLNIKEGLYKDKGPEELLAKAQTIMAKVIKETDRAAAITKKLSSFAKPAKGDAELVDVGEELEEVFSLVGYELQLEKIDLKKEIADDLPRILVDKKQFQEILFNLLRNAGQAIGDKGRISLRPGSPAARWS